MLASLTAFITKGTENMKYLEHEFRNLLTALEALMAGHLSSYLFPVSADETNGWDCGVLVERLR